MIPPATRLNLAKTFSKPTSFLPMPKMRPFTMEIVWMPVVLCQMTVPSAFFPRVKEVLFAPPCL